MSVSALNLISNGASSIPGSVRLPTQTLTQADFLKLVTKQLTNQDPMNPQSDTQFIAQMAQFSALEQSKSMQQDIANLQANSMLGRAVALQDDQGNLITGTVSAIQVQEGTPQIVVNGQAYDLRSVISIAPAPSNP